MEIERTKCLIIGSGPGGYTAAIYASRANLKPILYEGLLPGGQLMTTSEVEDYPGYTLGISGAAMMKDFQSQAQRMGADIRSGIISKVDFSKRPFHIQVDDKKEIEAETVIIATGARPKWMGIPSEQLFVGKGVSACAICDGFFFRNENVSVVGAGDSALEEALHLAKICKSVHLIVRKNKMKASKVLQDRIAQTKNIVVHYNSEIEEIRGSDLVGSIIVTNNQTKEKTTIEVKGVFVAIGHIPESDLFKGQVAMNNDGYIITDADSSRTSIEGVFACGDVKDRVFRQAVVAAGSGCMAAMEAERFMDKNQLPSSVITSTKESSVTNAL